jgi:transposase
LSERPSITRTWAPRGRTPQLHFAFCWRRLSVIAGVTWWQFYFRLFAGTVRGPQAVEFLRALRRQIRRPLLGIWDGLAVHRSRGVAQWVEHTGGAVRLARLPAYAPELNPVEYVWGPLKKHALANFCPKDFAQLGAQARRALRRAQRRPALVRAFWHQAQLSLQHDVNLLRETQ